MACAAGIRRLGEAMLTIVFDLDGTLVDTAPDLIERSISCWPRKACRRCRFDDARPNDRRRRARHDRARLDRRGPRLRAGRRRPRSTALSSPTTASISPTGRARSRASKRRSSAWPLPATGLRSAPTSSNGCRSGSSMRSSSAAVSRRSAARTHSACKSPIRRCSARPSARRRRARRVPSWSAIR